METLDLLVRGDVQGVGFRDFVQRRARETGLGGWVRNRPDGAVEVHAVGPRAALERLLAQVSRGPGLARVERVEPRWRAGGEAVGEFSIRS